MEAATLARPYARAAFETASDLKALDAWSADLTTAAALASDPRLAGLGNDPQVAPAQLAALCSPRELAADAPFGRYLAVLADNRRLDLLPEIARQFETLRRDAEHRLKVRVTSAVAIDAAQQASLAAALKQRHARDIDLEVHVDPAILGGAVLDVGGEVTDNSVRARLSQLQQALSR
ncbi:MAG TPA: F0F1 ATP synthase subunit delta [Rhodanobacteraceae bacterium]|nr:F0F1 ATP synthase subunit delta [Rhodanobacteraceae bacterium]